MSSAPAKPSAGKPGRIDFAGSPRATLGGGGEFALIDAQTPDLDHEAAGVVAEWGGSPTVHKELQRNTH